MIEQMKRHCLSDLSNTHFVNHAPLFIGLAARSEDDSRPAEPVDMRDELVRCMAGEVQIARLLLTPKQCDPEG